MNNTWVTNEDTNPTSTQPSSHLYTHVKLQICTAVALLACDQFSPRTISSQYIVTSFFLYNLMTLQCTGEKWYLARTVVARQYGNIQLCFYCFENLAYQSKNYGQILCAGNGKFLKSFQPDFSRLKNFVW